MTTKKTFRFRIDEDFEIDLSRFDFEESDTEEEIRQALIKWYFDECGYEGVTVEVADKKISLFEQIADVIKPM